MNACNGLISPIRKKWHFYGRSKNNSKKIKGYTLKFLVITALTRKIIVAGKFALNLFIRKRSPYLSELKYHERKAKIAKQTIRNITPNFFELYHQQKGKCKFCNQFMEFECIDDETKSESFKMSYTKPFFITSKQLGCDNKSLLHTSCYDRVYEIFGKT
jgi:hypothetical protein